MTLPFDGAISQYFEKDAPKDIRKAIKTGHKDDILNPTYPYDEEIAKQDYKTFKETKNRCKGRGHCHGCKGPR